MREVCTVEIQGADTPGGWPKRPWMLKTVSAAMCLLGVGCEEDSSWWVAKETMLNTVSAGS